MTERDDRSTETTGAFDWLGSSRRGSGETPEPSSASGGGPGHGRRPARRRTRKAGKRNDPNYHQASAYVRRDVYRQVQRALLASDDAPPDYSTLVETLLIEWLEDEGWPLEGS